MHLTTVVVLVHYPRIAANKPTPLQQIWQTSTTNTTTDHMTITLSSNFFTFAQKSTVNVYLFTPKYEEIEQKTT